MGIKGAIGIVWLVAVAAAGAADTPGTTVVITNDTVLAKDYYATTFVVRGDNIDVSLGGHTLYGTSGGQGAGRDKPHPLSIAFNIEGKNATIRDGKIRQYKNGISIASGLDFPSRAIAVEKWKRSPDEARAYLETFYSKGSDGAMLLNLDIETYQIGVYVNPYVQNFRLLDSRIKADWIGIYLDTGVRHSTIQGNRFENCGWKRYRFPKTPELYFARPQKRGKGREAIAVDGAHENLICGNTFTNSNLAAITLYSNCMEHIGGISGFMEAIHSQGLENDFRMVTTGRPDGLYGIEWLLGVGVMQVYAVLGMQGGQRFFSCKDGKEARKAAALYTVAGLFGLLVYFIPPMVARLMYADELAQMDVPNPSDVSYAFMATKLLPFGFVPLMVVAMFSAQMSTMDTALNANSALFVKNAYPALARLFGREPRTDHRFLLGLGRAFTVGLGLCLVGCSLYFAANAGQKGIFDIIFRFAAALLMPLLMPLFLGYFIRKTPMWSGWVCFGAGIMGSVAGTALGLPSFRMALLNSAVGFIAFVSTRLFWNKTPESSREKLARFFTRLHTPVNFDEEVGDANDSQQLKLIGLLSLFLGGFVAFFLFLPNPASARLCIASVAMVILSMGGILFFLG